MSNLDLAFYRIGFALCVLILLFVFGIVMWLFLIVIRYTLPDRIVVLTDVMNTNQLYRKLRHNELLLQQFSKEMRVIAKKYIDLSSNQHTDE